MARVLRNLPAAAVGLIIAGASWGGAFSLTEKEIDSEPPQPDLVTHPTGYTGAGGVLSVQVCIVPSTPNAGSMQVAIRNIVDRYNLLVPVNPNLRLGADNGILASEFDFESVALHEIGHCLGLNHPNAASESGQSGAAQEYTKALPGANGNFDLDDGTDNVIGSPDDQRGDDVNLHYFEIGVNNPFAEIAGPVDAMSYTRDLGALPGIDRFAANADRRVGAQIYGVIGTEAVMQQGTFMDEVQRALAADDVMTFRYARSGLDRLAGTSDDYQVELVYGGISEAQTCDINVSFDDGQTPFAVCAIRAQVSLDDQAAVITEASAYFNTNYNWEFPTVRIPLLAPDTALVAPGGSTDRVNGDDFSLLANDSHPAGLSLEVTGEARGGPEHGALVLNPDGSFQYTHNGDAAAEDRFVYEVCVAAAADACSHQLVTVTISASANQQPLPADDGFVVAEGALFQSSTSVLDNDQEPDGDPLILSTDPAVDPAFGTVTLAPDGFFAYAHDGTENFADSFVYEVCDDGDPPLCASAVVRAMITEINDPAAAGDDPLDAIGEDSEPLVIDHEMLLANDSPGDGEADQALQIVQLDSAVGGSLTSTANSITFVPDPDFFGPAGFGYTVEDDGTTDGAEDPTQAHADVTFEIFAVNDPPQVADKILPAVDEDNGPVTIDIQPDLIGAGDSPGPSNEGDQILGLASLENAFGGAVVQDGATVIFTLDEDFNGEAGFDITVSDDGLTDGQADPQTTTARASFEVRPINDAPRGIDDRLSLPVGGSTSLTIGYASSLLDNDYDPEADPIFIADFTLPQSGDLTLADDGRFTYVHSGAGPGSDQFTYDVCEVDSPNVYETATVVIDIGGVVFSPCTRDARRVVVGLPALIDSGVEFPVGGGTFAAQGLPASLSIDPASGLISGTPITGDLAGSPYAVVVTKGEASVGFGLIVEATADAVYFSGFEDLCFGFAD